MIVKSQSPDVTIPDVPITDYVLRHADRLGDKPALIDGPTGRTLTYRQLRDGVRRVAAGLAKRGFKKGDVLAIYSPNLPEYGLAMLGAASLGGIVTTANPLYTADELAKQLVDSGARLLVTVPPFLDKAKEAAAKAAASRRSSCSAMPRAPGPSPSSCSTGTSRPMSPSTRATTSSCCRTRAAPRACPRA